MCFLVNIIQVFFFVSVEIRKKALTPSLILTSFILSLIVSSASTDGK